MQYGGAAPLKQRPELVGAARGGDAHGESREGPVFGLLLFVVHNSRPALEL